MAVSGEGRSLEQTPTWAVATVCFVLVLISIVIEYVIHLIGKWFTKKHKRALYESLEKIKSELMLLGFISLLLTVGQGPISNICVSKSAGATWHPCSKSEEATTDDESEEHRRRLLSGGGGVRRVLAGATSDKCAAKGKVSFVSSEGIHQLHLFIFALALFHVLYCVLTMAFGRLKMKKWKQWEKETKTIEYEFSHDPERFRFARETSFGRRHLSLWTKNPILMWIVCFFRQFVRSVPRIDYLTLRHGFVMAHLTPQSQTNFNFQKYINRSLEEDFKVVVGISPVIWFFAVLFLLFNTHGWYSYLWLPFIPLIIILLVGTKLQVIITKMGLRIQEGGEVLKGVPVVELGDHLFWFNSPRLLLYLINFVLFQNAFQLAFFAWTWYEFGLKSCFHEHVEDITIRISMGVLIQILCSYVTLPLYALVTQMGSTMKLTIFNDKVATALRNWHYTAKKHVKHNNKAGGGVSPMSSRPATPSHHMSPAPLLGPRGSHIDSLHSNLDMDNSDTDSPSPSHQGDAQGGHGDGSSSRSNHHDHGDGDGDSDIDVDETSFSQEPVAADRTQHEVFIGSREFSFDRKSGVRFSSI